LVVGVTTSLARRLLAAVAVLVLGWLVAPAVAPIYDGIGNPDEPYRYVSAPAGAKATKPPTVARQALAVNASGLNAAGYSNSSEVGPQVVYYAPAGAFQAPAGAKQIVLSEVPQAPSAPLPTDGTIAGNVYHVTATANGQPVKVVGKGESGLPTLEMRAPSAKQPGPVFEYRDGARWRRSPGGTLRIGQDIYQTSAPVLGDWALVQLSSSAGKSGGGINVGLLVAGIAVLGVAGLIAIIRFTRSRAKA
jgi:hypothetical protein